MKLKLKRRRFDSIKEIQPESQDVIKTLKRNYFQAFSDNGNPAGVAVSI
jgi:hypothetical protein